MTKINTQTCHFCGSKDIRDFFNDSKNNAIYYKCIKCGLIWLDPEKRIDNAHNYYSNVYYKEGFSGRENIDAAFSYRFRFIDKYMNRAGSLLEVGAASGDFLHLLKYRGFTVYGVEVSRRAASVARERYGLNIFCGTLNEAEFPDNFFDNIVAYHVLEHVFDPQSFLKEAYRILKPGGALLIEVPNPTGFDARISRRLLKNILDFPNHSYLFPPKLFQNMLKDAGFTIITLETSFSFFIASFINKLRFYIKGSQHKQSSRNVYAKQGINVKHRTLLKFFSRFFTGMKLTAMVKK